jgi:hypothetical protein
MKLLVHPGDGIGTAIKAATVVTLGATRDRYGMRGRWSMMRLAMPAMKFPHHGAVGIVRHRAASGWVDGLDGEPGLHATPKAPLDSISIEIQYKDPNSEDRTWAPKPRCYMSALMTN